MDGEMRRLAVLNFVEWRVKIAKLTLAVAVIKSRPARESGRQHAEALALKLRNRDEAWRSKAKGLEKEVFRLRQELLLTKLQSKPRNMTSQDGDGFMDVFNQDLLGSAKDLPSSDMDSGHGTGNNTETLLPTQNSAETSTQPALPPVSSGPQFSFSILSEGDPQGTSMLLHMRFLQSLCGLQLMEGNGGLEAAELSTMDRDRSVVAESLCQLVSCVVAACGDARPLPPPLLLLQAARVAAQTVEQWTSHRKPSVHFVTHMEDALKELTGVLLRNNQFNRFQILEKISECLVYLGGSSLLKSLLIRHVLSEINRLADHFWHICQSGRDTLGPLHTDIKEFLLACNRQNTDPPETANKSRTSSAVGPCFMSHAYYLSSQSCSVVSGGSQNQGDREGPKQFEVDLYENSFYLFWILEQLLQGAQGPGRAESTGRIGHHWALEQKVLLGHLESSVPLLSDEFPLFALYLWRIGALLSPSDTTET